MMGVESMGTFFLRYITVFSIHMHKNALSASFMYTKVATAQTYALKLSQLHLYELLKANLSYFYIQYYP